jgi:hypothetical protein
MPLADAELRVIGPIIVSAELFVCVESGDVHCLVQTLERLTKAAPLKDLKLRHHILAITSS